MVNDSAFYRKINRTRKFMQWFSLLFLIAVPVLILLDVRWIIGNLYSISFWDFEIIDPSMVVQTLLMSWQFYASMFIAAIIPVLLAFIFGKVFCSYACPYNTILEFTSRFRSKKITENPKSNPNPYFYYAILALIAAIVLLFSVPVFSYLSFPGVISAHIAWLILGLGIGLELIVLGVVFVIEVVLNKRFWCKYVCPVGATLSLFRVKPTMSVTYDASECKCGQKIEPCSSSCPMELQPKKGNLYPFCYNCGLCVKACEATGNVAMRYTIGNNCL